ncbi:MAG: hypothetical protein WCG21_01650 [Eubacteriales bacterium]
MTDRIAGINVPSMARKTDWSLVERKIMDVFNQSDKECLDEKYVNPKNFGLPSREIDLDKIRNKKLLNVEEVMLYLGIGETAARNMLNKPGNSYTVKWGSRLYANQTKLNLWIDQNTGNYQGRSIL